MEEKTQIKTTNQTVDSRRSTPVHNFILNLFNQKGASSLIYHNYALTEQIVLATQEISEKNGYSKELSQAAAVAAWFYGTGYLFDYNNPLPKSIEIAERFMKLNEVPGAMQTEIYAAIKSVFYRQFSKSKVAQILNDAVISTHNNEFLTQNPLLRLEKELMSNELFSKLAWSEFQLEELLKSKYYTPYGKVTFEPILSKNIMAQKEIVEKNRRNPNAQNEIEITRKFQNLERKLPGSGTQTFFRTNYRNHINLSAIADNKANIMISVNAIVISVIMSVIFYRNLTEWQPEIMMPALIFVVTGLTSLIFAVLSARPKITSVNQSLNLGEAKKNIVFFGNFANLDLETYEEAMDAMFRDSELLYGNMTRDLYYLGKVLDKKYKYLTISYNVFMIGFVATVLAFLIALMF